MLLNSRIFSSFEPFLDLDFRELPSLLRFYRTELALALISECRIQGGSMNRAMLRSSSIREWLLAIGILLTSPASFSTDLNLGPLPGVGQVREILLPGSGQGYVGFATIYMGQPVIFYDNVWIQQFGGVGSPGFRFTRAHEYAHHFRGHVLANFSTPPHALPGLGYQSELDADCAAVHYLKQVGDQAAVQAGYQLYQAIVPPQDMNGRPGSVARINNMNGC